MITIEAAGLLLLLVGSWVGWFIFGFIAGKGDDTKD